MTACGSPTDQPPHKVLTAYSTLTRGTAFLSASARQLGLDEPWPDGRPGTVRARFFGNCLSELDRFLHVLMDETAVARSGRPNPARHNAALKLGVVGEWLPRLPWYQLRLRALGRSRASLVHLSGVARRPDGPGERWMTAGWRDAATDELRLYRLGERLAPTGGDLADVCQFYGHIADDLLHIAARSQGVTRIMVNKSSA